jgi:hypothetical protein
MLVGASLRYSQAPLEIMQEVLCLLHYFFLVILSANADKIIQKKLLFIKIKS